MAGYIGSKVAVVSSGAERKKVFTATSGQTSFTGLSYTVNNVHVFQNGVRLVDGTDYTATNGNSITLTVGAATDDQVVVVSYNTFQTSDTVSASTGGTFSNAVTIDADGSTVLTVDRATSDGTIIDVQKSGSSVGSIGTVASDLTIGLGTAAVRFRDSAPAIHPWNMSTNAASDNTTDVGTAGNRFKDLYLSGGAYLGGTGSANKLDDYEEGTWTPAFQNLGSGSVSYGTRSGYYRKIGDLVYAFFNIQNSAVSGTSSESVEINVPFTPNISNTREIASGSAASYNNDWPQNGTLVTRLQSGGLRFMVAADNATWSSVAYENSSQIYWEGHVWYRTNS